MKVALFDILSLSQTLDDSSQKEILRLATRPTYLSIISRTVLPTVSSRSLSKIPCTLWTNMLLVIFLQVPEIHLSVPLLVLIPVHHFNDMLLPAEHLPEPHIWKKTESKIKETLIR